MAFDEHIAEEQLKHEVAETVFSDFDCGRIIGKIDFCVSPRMGGGEGEKMGEDDFLVPSYVWAEAKRGQADLRRAMVQLLLTVGRARTFDQHLPPKYLAAFDSLGMVMVPYGSVHEVFYQNDFNWQVAANDYSTKEFQQLQELVGETLGRESLRFVWHGGGEEVRVDSTLRAFIEKNFNATPGTVKLPIDEHNFISVYNRWQQTVRPTIGMEGGWQKAEQCGIIDADFYLADLLSRENMSILDKLNVLLQHDRYRLAEGVSRTGNPLFSEYQLTDGGEAHRIFWNCYERPPSVELWDYIIERRDLLVPNDVRAFKGAFFTPNEWVKLSQEYLAEQLGADWQEEYYVWDCAAGTGNLLVGLTQPRRVWASTIDQADVDVMQQLIEKGAGLFANHVFQFDFLNDGWEKLPGELRAIVEDPEERKKLVIYINPPYAEAGNVRMIGKGTKSKAGVAKKTAISQRYGEKIGRARNEVYALFFTRVAEEIPGCVLASFCTTKILLGPSFEQFRDYFTPALKKLFIVPSYTFDNVPGAFGIGFFIWFLQEERNKMLVSAQHYDEGAKKVVVRKIDYRTKPNINQWIKSYLPANDELGLLVATSADMQNKDMTFIDLIGTRAHHTNFPLSIGNLIPCTIYFAIRHCIKATWLNNRDQFLWPKDEWMTDDAFHGDCLVYTIFHRLNRISHADGPNHWIPYTEKELGLKLAFESSFLSDFMAGKLKATGGSDTQGLGLDGQEGNAKKALFATGQTPLVFSDEAKVLLEAGREMWRYYLSKPGVDIDASFYDIRAYFQGMTANGKAVRSKSDDAVYTELYAKIRDARKHLGDKRIAPKVYEYGFLME